MAGNNTDIDAESPRRAMLPIGQSTDDTEAAATNQTAAGQTDQITATAPDLPL